MQENVKATLIFRGGCRLENLGSKDKKRIAEFDFAEIASTLLSRDYKGLSNYASNGVIEIWQIDKQ